MKRIATVFAALALALAAAPAANAATYNCGGSSCGDLQHEVYYVYNSDCGGANPWHSTGFYWWCINRNVDLYTESHNSNYTQGDVVYCYTEAKIGATKERCMEVRTTPWYIIQMLAYWTNAG